MDKLYGKYFQKSRSFLYPVLGIPKKAIATPLGTYVSLEGMYPPEEMKLICTYKKEVTPEFEKFEEQMLLTNPLFHDLLSVDSYNMYVFDYKSYEVDWFNFLLGKYSKLSAPVKKSIKLYYGEKSSEYEYIKTYLNPSDHFETYSKLLDVDVSVLKKLGELCDPCDLDKETLKVSLENVKLLKKQF